MSYKSVILQQDVKRVFTIAGLRFPVFSSESLEIVLLA